MTVCRFASSSSRKAYRQVAHALTCLPFHLAMYAMAEGSFMSTIPERPTTPQSRWRLSQNIMRAHIPEYVAWLRLLVAAVVVCVLVLGISIGRPAISQSIAAHTAFTQEATPTTPCSGLMTGC